MHNPPSVQCPRFMITDLTTNTEYTIHKPRLHRAVASQRSIGLHSQSFPWNFTIAQDQQSKHVSNLSNTAGYPATRSCKNHGQVEVSFTYDFTVKTLWTCVLVLKDMEKTFPTSKAKWRGSTAHHLSSYWFCAIGVPLFHYICSRKVGSVIHINHMCTMMDIHDHHFPLLLWLYI